MQVRPLHRRRYRGVKTQIQYGNQQYYTADHDLSISYHRSYDGTGVYMGEGWYIRHRAAHPRLDRIIMNAGLYDTVFERLRDALCALEQVEVNEQ